MLLVVFTTGVLRARQQHLWSCSHGRFLPTPWRRSWSSLVTVWRDLLPLGCLPVPLGTWDVLCSKQIILGLGKGRRGISGQRKRLTWCHTGGYLSVWHSGTWELQPWALNTPSRAELWNSAADVIKAIYLLPRMGAQGPSAVAWSSEYSFQDATGHVPYTGSTSEAPVPGQKESRHPPL